MGAKNDGAHRASFTCRRCALRFGDQSHFHEAAFDLPKPAQAVIEKLAGHRILAGVSLGRDYAGMDSVLLACTTETKTMADIESFALALESALA